MAFIKNTDLLVEGSSNVFFTGDRARQEAVENSIASGVTNKAPSQAAVQSALDLKLDSSQVGASGGVASLGEDGKIPSSQLPALALTDVHVVADNTERDALTVEEGDVAIVTGTGKTWIYDGSAWQELTAAGAVISVNGETGAVSLDSDDVPEGSSNLYFADALAQGAVVVDSSSGTETNKSMSVSAAKAYSESQAGAASGAAVSYADENFVAASGDTMSGVLNIQSTSAASRRFQLEAKAEGDAQLGLNEIMGEFNYRAIQSNGSMTSTVKLQGQATENHSESALGSKLNVEITPDGETSRQLVASFKGEQVEIKKPLIVEGQDGLTGQSLAVSGAINANKAVTIESGGSPSNRRFNLNASNNGAQLFDSTILGEHNFRALSSDLSTYFTTVKLDAVATEFHSESGLGTKYRMAVTPNGSTTRVTVAEFRGDGIQFFRDVDLDGSLLTGIASPSGSTDAANKAYVDAASGALATEDLSFYKLDGTRALSGDLAMLANQSIDVNGQSYVQMISAGIKFNRGQILPLQVLTTSGNASTQAQVVVADADSGAVTVTLPNVTGIAGRVYHVKGVNNGTNAVTVQGTAGQAVDGASGGFELSVENESITLVAGSSPAIGWYIL